MKIISYNINGIRAAIKKGLVEWIAANDFDILCFQETKAQPEQIDSEAFEKLGYHCHWHSAVKKGYSGVGIISKMKPDNIVVGCGIDTYDNEGRILRADFGDLSVMSVYIPSGSSGDVRQDLKMVFLDDFLKFTNELRQERPQLIISGDYNICHKAIDIHNPKTNKNTSGFKPEERAWMDDFFGTGFIDSFRHFNPDPHHYSWWSYRANARNNNKGWRIDYHSATDKLKDRLTAASILSDVKHSDHCPILVELK